MGKFSLVSMFDFSVVAPVELQIAMQILLKFGKETLTEYKTINFIFGIIIWDTVRTNKSLDNKKHTYNKD